jgi:AraC-like DNA-binding protein
VAGVRYAVDEHSALLLNHGRLYSSHTSPGEEVETFSVFFERGFAAATLRGLADSEERLLDDPGGTSDQAVEFFETLYPLDTELAGYLREMRDRIAQWCDEPIWLEERLHHLLVHLLHRHSGMVRESEGLPAARPATRIEQYRRLLRARDYIEGNLGDEIDLASIASAACLSSFHLLRLFKQAFGETPHKYLTRRRLEVARHLLLTTDLPVWRICHEVGYESLSSFSRLVAKRYGASPRCIRRESASA